MRKEIKLLLLSFGLFLLAGGLLGPIYAIFVERIGGDLLTAGGSYSVFALAAGILIFFISKWEDRIKHQEKLVIISYAIAAIGFLGYLFVKTPLQLFFIQAIFGIGTAIGSPAYDGTYSKYLEKGKFASQWGAWESMHWIVIGISSALGGFIAKTYGFQTLFTIMFTLSLLAIIVSLFLLKSKKS